MISLLVQTKCRELIFRLASELGQTCWCGSATTCLYSHCLMVEQNCYVGSDDNRFDYFGLRNVKITPPDPTVFPHCGPVQNIG